MCSSQGIMGSHHTSTQLPWHRRLSCHTLTWNSSRMIPWHLIMIHEACGMCTSPRIEHKMPRHVNQLTSPILPGSPVLWFLAFRLNLNANCFFGFFILWFLFQRCTNAYFFHRQSTIYVCMYAVCVCVYLNVRKQMCTQYTICIHKYTCIHTI